MSRIAAYMRHQHVDILYAETIELLERIAYVAAIHIAIYGARRLELPQAAQYLIAAYVSCVPNLIHIPEMFQYAFVQQTVGIA